MTQIRRAIVAISAATALAGTGLTLATEAAAGTAPASWGCSKAVENTKPKIYRVYCLHIPSGHKVRVVLNCTIFPTGKIDHYYGDWVGNVAISDVSSGPCISRDGHVSSYGPDAG